MRSAVIIFLLAAILIAGGLFAYTSAPPEANATTALIVPGVSALILITLGVLLAGASSRGRVDHAGALHIVCMVLALAFAAAFAHRARSAGESVRAYEEASLQFDELVAEGEARDREQARHAHLEQLGAPRYSRAYLTGTLWTLSGFSFAAFIALLFTRPGVTADVANGATHDAARKRARSSEQADTASLSSHDRTDREV